jgi:hypothetical protein
VQQWLHAHFDLGNIRRSDPFGTIRLLTRAELQRLFPQSTIVAEPVGPLVKSWYAVFRGLE